MKKNRLIFMSLVLLATFFILVYRLFTLTVVQGDSLREQADNNRTKQINHKAARGQIFDRNGNVLAGNIAVHNLNVYKDRFNSIDQEDKNHTLNTLVHILEKGGVSYLDNFQIQIYEFIFKNNTDYFTNDKLPNQVIADLLNDDQIISKVMNSYTEIDGKEKLEFYPIFRILNYLETSGKGLPIEVSTEQGIELSFIENDRYRTLESEGKITEDSSPLELLIDTISGDTSLILNLLEHPLSRKVAYEILNQDGLVDNIGLTDYVFSFDIDYIEQKAKMHRINPEVTLDSEAKDDFLNLVKGSTLDRLLTMTKVEESGEILIPAEYLINQINALGLESQVSYDYDQENDQVNLKFIDNEERSETPSNYLIRIAQDNNLLDSFILHQDILPLAEQSLFASGIYPRIYKAPRWEYSAIADKSDFLPRGADENSTADDVIEIYKERYKLEGYSKYETFAIISINNKANSSGYRAYEPITLAKNLGESTLIAVEEYLPRDLGFEVIQEPNRIYPNGNTFSHSLGYLGRISDQNLINELIDTRQYSADDIVGKTGLEESFESTLRGKNGSTLVYADVSGNTTGVIEEVAPVAGNNLYTTIDLDFQKDVEDMLKNAIISKNTGEEYVSYHYPLVFSENEDTKSGAIVVSDVKTGEIFAMASYPDFDPNMFVNGISSYDWANLSNKDSNNIFSARNLVNLSIQEAIPPGSTFKTVSSLAALEKGWNPRKKITCYGVMEIGNSRFGDYIYNFQGGGSHGPIDMYEALRVSCNYYFYSLGLGRNPRADGEVDTQITLDDLTTTITKLGLNENTGIEINIPYESRGTYPSLFAKQSGIRNSLRTMLNSNLELYLIEEKNDEEIQEDINKIVSWVENGPNNTRAFVVSELYDMGYEAEVARTSGPNLADRIKYSYLNQAVWTEADSLNMVIGQGQNGYTPLQMNMLTSIIANKGKRVKPTFVKEIKSNDQQSIYTNEVDSVELDFNKENFDHIEEGMRIMSNSSRFLRKLPFEVASKTGTAETGIINPETGNEYDPYSWFVSYGPIEDPEIAITIMIVESNNTSEVGIIASDIYYSYFKNIKNDSRFTNER